MTGEKNRYKPLDKLKGIDNEQFGTPKHDKMVLSLFDDNHISKLHNFIDILFTDEKFGNGEIGYKSPKISSEIPIVNDRGFIIGYYDIVLIYPKYNTKTREFAGELRINIEVKPEIKSFGNTLRQLNTYRQFRTDKNEVFALYTNDLRYKEAFESQGITVLHD